MQHADETLLSVVVLEVGSSWPPWLGEYQKQAPSSVVIAQSVGESGREFTRRITRRMVEIAASDEVIHAALLVSNGALDELSVTARKRICASLLGVMIRKRRGELVLAADVRAGDDLRHELFELAGTLCDELPGTEVSVRVRFGNGRPESGASRAESGVMKSVAPPSELAEIAEERVAQNGRD